MGDNFVYLGRNFSFDMNNVDVKAEFVTDMNNYFDVLNRLPLHPKHKLLIISKYVYSKLRCRFSIGWLHKYLGYTQFRLIVKEYTRRWFRLSQSANTSHVYLPV